MINVYSPNESNFKNNGLATLIPISCDLDIGINGKWQLTMEHPFDKELRYQHLVEDAILRVTGVSCVNEQEQDTDRFGLNGKVQLFRVFDINKTLTSVTVIAFPVALEAVYDTPIENLIIQNKTGIQAGEILDSQTQKYSISSDITRTASSKYENTNLIASISGDNDDSYVKKWGGEVVYDNYKIKIKNKIGDQNNASAYPIRYGRNLTGLSHEIDMSSVVTRMFPISSDDLRLNVWEDVTSQGGNRYVDSSDHISDYPFIRCLFVEVDYSLLDTDSKSISETATATNGWREGIINAVTAQATALWTSIIQDLTNAYSPEYIQDLISGEDGIVGYLQKKYVYSHKGWQSFVKSCVKQGVEWIKSEDLPIWEWHEDTSVTPHAWWYGDNSVSPAVSYAKNEYVKIGKNYEYFNNDGFWEDYKAMPQDDCDWYEAKDGSGKKWYGYRKGYYAHNEYVYMTVEGQMKEWWYDEEGWYDESRSGDSDMGWHGDATSGYWFGEEDATSEDTNKFLHDKWAWIDGNYYWFDQYGYISGELDIPDYPWFVIETTQGSWFGNDQDEMLGAKWFANQWAEIDGEWYYFDADGYVVDMTAKQSETIAWFANTVYNNTIEYITGCLTNAYTLLYRLMREWCEKQYADGIDLPTVNVSVDLIDLSKTTEYKDYSNLEQISLGDKVLVIGRDGSRYEERVVGLTFDCIRGYNTQIEVGQLSKSVSQIINVSYSGASEGQKIIAGDGVTIDGKVISVGDYVGRTIGLQDVLLNGSTTVSGNVSSFGIQAGDNISISRSGNVLTINSTAEEGNKVYAGTSTPSASIGAEDDLYLQLGVKTEDILAADRFEGQSSGSHVTSLSDFTRTARNKFSFKINGNPDSSGNGETGTFTLDGLVVGNTYHIEYDVQYNSGATFPYINEGLAICNTFIAHPHNTNLNHISGDFTYIADGEAQFRFFAIEDNTDFTCTITNLTITGNFYDGIEEIYGKISGKWEKYEGGESYTAGSNIDITNNVISGAYQAFTGTDGTADGASGLVPAPTTADANKYLSSAGTWEAMQGGGSNLIMDAEIYSEDEKQVGVWIDGRPLYRKTVKSTTTPSSSAWTSILLDLPSDAVIKMYSAYYRRTNNRTDLIPQYNPSSNNEWLYGAISSNNFVYKVSSPYTSNFVQTDVIVTYIKSNDAAGSGGYQAWGFSPIIYSETEREIGVWTDNKPLYKRTLHAQINGDSSPKKMLDLTIENIETVVCGDGYILNTDNGSTLATQIGDYISSNHLGGWFKGVDGGLYVYYGAYYSAHGYSDIYLTIQYTKTTDTAGSGSYNTLGVPNVHYSTTEQVIGTWIDGKPIYEKTFEITAQNIYNSATVINGLTIPDYKHIISCQAISTDYPQASPIMLFYNQGQWKAIALGGINVNKLVIQYTKTTD